MKLLIPEIEGQVCYNQKQKVQKEIFFLFIGNVIHVRQRANCEFKKKHHAHNLSIRASYSPFLAKY